MQHSLQTPSRRRSRSPTAVSRGRSASPRQSHDASGPVRNTSGRQPTAPACDRCRSYKKKCSRTFPACTLCVAANQTCSYSAPPATPEAENVQLRARVQWFSEYINHHLSRSQHGAGIEQVETGTDLASLLGGGLDLTPAHLRALQPQAQLGNAGFRPANLQIDGNSNTSPINLDGAGPATAHTQESNGSSNLPNAAARRFVDAYFRNVDSAYPFINQDKVLENLETLGPLARRLRNSQSTLLYLIMSIGCTTLERASQVSRDTAERFDVAYAEIIQECISRDGIESVQILMLLALYSLFDPAGVSAYDTVGVAARRAITTGLTRRPTDEKAYAPAENELRNRL